MKYLSFTINLCRFALDINQVFEILIPGINGNISPEKMLAEKSMVYQDRQIPIIILADFLFNIPQDNPVDFRIILCEINGKIFGLLVDNADEIVCLSQENIISASKSSPELKTDFLRGKFVEDGKEIFIVEPNKILSAVEAR